MKKIIGLIVGLGLLSAPAVFAANNGSGCGLGKKLFEGQKGLIPNISAQTTNGSSSSQNFGLTSGTSGCDEDSVILKEKEQEIFVAMNLDNLSEDIAQGSGQYLQSMGALMGCDADTFAAFSRITQEKYEILFPTVYTNPHEFLLGLRRELAVYPIISANCIRIS